MAKAAMTMPTNMKKVLRIEGVRFVEAKSKMTVEEICSLDVEMLPILLLRRMPNAVGRVEKEVRHMGPALEQLNYRTS